MKKIREKLKNMNEKNKKIFFLSVIVFSVLLILGVTGLTYAWFSAIVSGNSAAKGATVETGVLSIKYTNGNEIKGENILPGWTMAKTFTVENTGTVPATYKINWENLTNEFVNKSDLVYTLTSTNSGGTLSETQIPNTGEHVNILNNITIPAGVIQTYTLTITYKNRNADQSSDMGKKLLGKIEVLDINDSGVKDPGLYNSEGVMIASWDELVNDYDMDVEKNCEMLLGDELSEENAAIVINNLLNNEEGKLIIPDNITIIGDYAFFQATTLTSIEIPGSVTEIGNFAFSNSGLTSVTIPDSVTSVGFQAFSQCHNLTQVTLGKGINTIASSTFYMTGLTSILIPDNITTIEGNAFQYSSLTSVTIPASVTSIGNKAFYDSFLTSVYFEHTTPPTFGSDCFPEPHVGAYSHTCGKEITFYFKNSNVRSAYAPLNSGSSECVTLSTNYNW